MLTPDQIANYRQQGFLIVEDVVHKEELQAIHRSLDAWIELSKQHTAPFGRMRDGRPRFDLEPDHCADSPALRRIASPEEVSSCWLGLLLNGPLAKTAASVIGPNVRLHHAKINIKMPRSSTEVKWHQDFPFDPHSNDDCVTVMLYLDDVTTENGAPRIVPGSHKGPIYSLWHGGIFTGAVADDVARQCERNAVECTGNSGAVCLMHTRALHGSSANSGTAPRALFIANLTSADAIPLAPNAVPSAHSGSILLGHDPGIIRTQKFDLEMPEIPLGASFFNQQSQSA